jgi:hypothetical protein
VFLFLFFFFFGTRIWTQGSPLAKLVLYHLSHFTSPFFFQADSCAFLLGSALNCDPLTYASGVIGMTGVSHHTQPKRLIPVVYWNIQVHAYLIRYHKTEKSKRGNNWRKKIVLDLHGLILQLLDSIISLFLFLLSFSVAVSVLWIPKVLYPLSILCSDLVLLPFWTVRCNLGSKCNNSLVFQWCTLILCRLLFSQSPHYTWFDLLQKHNLSAQVQFLHIHF